MLTLFRKRIESVNGILSDIRIPEEKQKDYKIEEVLVMNAPLIWPTWEEWKARQNTIKMLDDIEVNMQNRVGSCGAQGGSLIIGINNYLEDEIFLKCSAKPVYASRKNAGPGMYGDDLGKILITTGTVFEILYPSPNDTETNMSNLDGYISAFQALGKILRAKSFIYVPPTIDAFAQILAMGKPLGLTIKFGDHEWGLEMVPQIKDTILPYGHYIVGLQTGYFTYQGKKTIFIQDSHGVNVGYGGRRIITEDWFLNNRILFGQLFEDLNNLAIFNEQTEKPKYQWRQDLYVGCINEDVRMLQLALATIQDDEGYLFPLATQKATGQFWGITRNAVQRFQIKYGIEPVLGYCGPLTRAKLNQLFN